MHRETCRGVHMAPQPSWAVGQAVVIPPAPLCDQQQCNPVATIPNHSHLRGKMQIFPGWGVTSPQFENPCQSSPRLLPPSSVQTNAAATYCSYVSTPLEDRQWGGAKTNQHEAELARI